MFKELLDDTYILHAYCIYCIPKFVPVLRAGRFTPGKCSPLTPTTKRFLYVPLKPGTCICLSAISPKSLHTPSNPGPVYHFLESFPPRVKAGKLIHSGLDLLYAVQRKTGALCGSGSEETGGEDSNRDGTGMSRGVEIKKQEPRTGRMGRWSEGGRDRGGDEEREGEGFGDGRRGGLERGRDGDRRDGREGFGWRSGKMP